MKWAGFRLLACADANGEIRSIDSATDVQLAGKGLCQTSPAIITPLKGMLRIRSDSRL
jgi:hypothetical protein